MAAPHEDLLSLRAEFPILEHTTYLINNSLGAMPRAVEDEVAAFAKSWGERGVRAWGEGWWEMAAETGDLLAPLLGVRPGSVSMHQNVAVAGAIFLSAMDYPAERNKIVYTELNFPNVMYLLEGERKKGAEIVVVPSDDGIGVPTERLLAAIDERTRLVPISHTLFRSAFVQDAQAIARRCREVGAVLLLDVYQSTGVLPLELEAWGVHAAMGGSVKWLCGGPGAGYLWVEPDFALTLQPSFIGWQADEEPFAFRPGPIHLRDEPAWRFLTGTPNVPALYSCRPGYRIVAGVGARKIRERSLALTAHLMGLAEEAGFELRTPRDPKHRGGTVSIFHPDADRLCHELIDREIVCDFRPNAGIRLSPHFFNTEAELEHAVATLKTLAGR
jgi:kynureninase